jgi:hypothetical protein
MLIFFLSCIWAAPSVCVPCRDAACSYTGFCDLGISWQTLENPDHRASLGLPPRCGRISKAPAGSAM